MVDMAQADSTLRTPPRNRDEGVFDRFRQRLRKLSNDYEIYKANAESLGWPVKTFNEWLDS